MNEDEEIEKLIDDLVDIGALVRSHNGREVIYNVNSERMLEVYPAFYELFMADINEALIDLVEQGLVNVDYDENLKPWFSVTEEGQKVVDSIILSGRPFDV